MSQQVYIFEGIDMVGKTTIAKSFAQYLSISYYAEKHRDKWYDHLLDITYAEEARVQMLEQIGFSVVLDRSYPSEYAYAKAYERPLAENRIWELDKRYNNLGAKIIYCYKQKKFWQKDKTKLIEKVMYEKIDKFFNEFFDRTSCDVIYLDTSEQDTVKQIEEIKEKMHEHRYL